MGLIIGLIKRLLKLIVYTLVFAAIIVLIPNLPPYTKFTSISVEPTLQKVGPLAPNEALNNAQQVYKGKLLGPEAFQIVDGELYTSLATGEIVKISPGGHVTFVTKLGLPCTGLKQEHICGRPLGFQIVGSNMFIADAYHGIWKVDLKTDKKQLLVSPRVEIDGKRPMLFNSVAIDKKGNLYWTDSSSDVQLKDGAYSTLLDPSGRLFQYNAAKNESKVLMDKLWFANGLAVSPDDTFLVVSETMAYKLIKYYINGPKKGQSEVFIAGLPGMPDNVRALPDGSGVLVALYSSFDQDHVLLAKSMGETPVVRKFLTRLQKLIETPFEFLNNIYPHFLFEDVTYYIGHFKSVSGFLPSITGLVQLDWDGKVVAAYYNTDQTLSPVSDAVVYNDRLYTGSPHGADFIGSVPAPPLLKKAFTPIKSENVKTTQPKVETKPVEQHKVKPQEQPKLKPQEPKVEVKKEAPKVAKPVTEAPKVAKPVTEAPKVAKPVTEAPKVAKPVTEAPKPTQQVPKATTQIPIETKPTAQPVKPTAKPDQRTTPQAKTEQKTTKQATNTEQKKTTPPQPETKTTPTPRATEKPKVQSPQQKESASSTTAKPPVTTPKTAQKKVEPQVKSEDAKSKGSEPKPQKAATEAKPTPEQIPIEEEIPSDTIKPSKETLKVIKKGGPAEIPNPNL